MFDTRVAVLDKSNYTSWTQEWYRWNVDQAEFKNRTEMSLPKKYEPSKKATPDFCEEGSTSYTFFVLIKNFLVLPIIQGFWCTEISIFS